MKKYVHPFCPKRTEKCKNIAKKVVSVWEVLVVLRKNCMFSGLCLNIAGFSTKCPPALPAPFVAFSGSVCRNFFRIVDICGQPYIEHCHIYTNIRDWETFTNIQLRKIYMLQNVLFCANFSTLSAEKCYFFSYLCG